ncbi:MAG: hypothetical protein JKY65_13710 [Planctomycetes bacterium]|nr:hypothetical protein [Planctomycetota bacterium]
MEEQEAQEPAGWGLTLGIMLVVLIMGGGVCALMIVPGLSQARAKVSVTRCSSSLREVGVATQMYVDAKGHYPYADGDWEATVRLLREIGFLSEQPLSCPNNTTSTPYEGFQVAYPKAIPHYAPLAWDTTPHLNGNGKQRRNVLFADGRIEQVGESIFITLLADQEELRAKLAAGQGLTTPTPTPSSR